MREAEHPLPRVVIWLLIVVPLSVVLVTAPLVFAALPMQENVAVDISEKECAFWLDFDGDGEGDEPVDTHPDRFALQETAIVGGCEFKLNAQAEATLVIMSELDDWSSEVELIQEPGMPRNFTRHPGNIEIPGLEGRMRIKVDHTGITPRSLRLRTLRDRYEHQVQVPRSFRLLELTVITADGRQDRLEESVQSASAAYIHAQQLLVGESVDPGAEASGAVVGLASELLEEGYPQIATDVLSLNDVAVGRGVSAAWMWATIILAVVLLVAIVGVTAFVYLPGRSMSSEIGPGSTVGRRNNM